MLHAITALRFFAFLCIYILHASCYSWFDFPRDSSAASGVSFFILLSGFLYGFRGDFKIAGLRDVVAFIQNKIHKFYLLYFGTLIVTLFYYNGGIVNVFCKDSPDAIKEYVVCFIHNLFLIQSWFKEDMFSFNGVAWFLSTILFLYLCTPFLFVGLKKTKEYFGCFALILLCGLMALTNLFVCYMMYIHKMSMTYWAYVFPLSRFPEYCFAMGVGMLFQVWESRHPTRQSFVARLSYTLLEICAVVLWFYSLHHKFTWDWCFYNTSYWLFPNLVVILTFVLQRGYFSEFISQHFFVWLGAISMPAFLLHQIVIRIASYIIVPATCNTLEKMAAWLLCLFVTISIGGLYLHVVQKNKSVPIKCAPFNYSGKRIMAWNILTVILSLFFIVCLLWHFMDCRPKWIKLSFTVKSEDQSDLDKIKTINVLYTTLVKPRFSDQVHVWASRSCPINRHRYTVQLPADVQKFRIDFRMREKTIATAMKYPILDDVVLDDKKLSASSASRPVFDLHNAFPCFLFSINK